MKTLRGFGTFDFVEDATNQATYDSGEARRLCFDSISINPNVEREKTRVFSMAGPLTLGDSYVNYFDATLRFSSTRATREHIAAMMMGTLGTLAANRQPVNLFTKTSLKGVACINIYHPAEPTIAMITWLYVGVLLLSPDGGLEMARENTATPAFMVDIDLDNKGTFDVTDLMELEYPAQT